MAADRGAAILRNGQWSVLGEGQARDVTFALDGSLWVAERTLDSMETVVTSFRFDGGAWVGTALPTLSTPGWPVVAIDRDGAPWVGSGGWFGSLDRFDGQRWVDESRLITSDSGNVAGLAVGPTGDLWVAVTSATTPAQWAWTIARHDGTTWSVHDPADGLAAPGILLWPGALAIAPDGGVWLTADRGIARFDGRLWSLPVGSSTFVGMSFGPDGTLWAIGPSGVQRLPAAAGG